MYKIDKTLIDNMNLNRSCIVITPRETVKIAENVMSVEEEAQISPAVREKMREFVQNATEKAQQILRDAKVEAEQIREAARSQGYETGIAQGRQKADAELKEKYKEVKDVLSRIDDYRQDLYIMLESDVLSLSMDVAEKIVDIAIQRDENVFKDIVIKAIEGIKHADNFSLYVSRAEYDKYFKGDDMWLRKQTGSKQFEVICGGNLTQGSCIVETDNEIVDASIPMQLGKIRQLLKEQVE